MILTIICAWVITFHLVSEKKFPTSLRKVIFSFLIWDFQKRRKATLLQRSEFFLSRYVMVNIFLRGEVETQFENSMPRIAWKKQRRTESEDKSNIWW